MIQPTVGRVVWFRTRQTALTGGGTGPLAAIVAFVHGGSMVNLTVFDANGTPHSRTSVPLVQAGGQPPAHGDYCEWMPYQLGQAAKTEAAEKRAATPAPQ